MSQTDRHKDENTTITRQTEYERENANISEPAAHQDISRLVPSSIRPNGWIVRLSF
jgi:hypothetical protein